MAYPPTGLVRQKGRQDSFGLVGYSLISYGLISHLEESAFGTITVDPLIVKIQQELNGLTDTHYETLEDYRQQLGDELVSYAVDVSVGNGVRNWNYVQAILHGWLSENVKTIGEAKAAQVRHKQKAAPQRGGKVVGAQKYQQRDYNESQLQDALGVSDLFREAAG